MSQTLELECHGSPPGSLPLTTLVISNMLIKFVCLCFLTNEMRMNLEYLFFNLYIYVSTGVED